MSNEKPNGNFAKPMLPVAIPFNGEWKLLENEKPVGFIDVLCILSNHAIVPLRFSDMLEENKGFFRSRISITANGWRYAPVPCTMNEFINLKITYI